MDNYYDYEMGLLSVGSRMVIYHGEDLFSMHRERILISRNIINLLSACRMYLDQSVHIMGIICKDDTEKYNQLKNEKKHNMIS